MATQRGRDWGEHAQSQEDQAGDSRSLPILSLGPHSTSHKLPGLESTFLQTRPLSPASLPALVPSSTSQCPAQCPHAGHCCELCGPFTTLYPPPPTPASSDSRAPNSPSCPPSGHQTLATVPPRLHPHPTATGPAASPNGRQGVSTSPPRMIL